MEKQNNPIEVEGRVATYDNGRIRIYTELLDGTSWLHFGDKVRIVVIKEEEE